MDCLSRTLKICGTALRWNLTNGHVPVTGHWTVGRNPRTLYRVLPDPDRRTSALHLQNKAVEAGSDTPESVFHESKWPRGRKPGSHLSTHTDKEQGQGGRPNSRWSGGCIPRGRAHAWDDDDGTQRIMVEQTAGPRKTGSAGTLAVSARASAKG